MTPTDEVLIQQSLAIREALANTHRLIIIIEKLLTESNLPTAEDDDPDNHPGAGGPCRSQVTKPHDMMGVQHPGASFLKDYQ